MDKYSNTLTIKNALSTLDCRKVKEAYSLGNNSEKVILTEVAIINTKPSINVTILSAYDHAMVLNSEEVKVLYVRLKALLEGNI